jgi:hypothetical protein
MMVKGKLSEKKVEKDIRERGKGAKEQRSKGAKEQSSKVAK